MILHQVPNSYGNYNYNAFIYTETLWESHFHGNYELIYGIEGETEVLLNSIKYTLTKGELILVSPYTIHSLNGFKNSKIWVGVFSEDFIVSFAEKNKFTSFIKFRCDAKINSILEENLFYQGEPEHYLLVACLYMVCNECLKNASSTSKKQDNKFVYQVIEYISENLSENISLKKIAYNLNYEYHYFSALFNKYFFMNFKNFINIYRFDMACKLLANRYETVTSVCNQCGFGSIRNFNRVFKQLGGLTPSEYRNNLPLQHKS